MEGMTPTATREQYLEALNVARLRYDQALIGEGLRDGQDRWTVLADMEKAQRQALTWLEEHGVPVIYSLEKRCYEEVGHVGIAAATDEPR